MQRFDKMMQGVDVYLCNESLWRGDKEPDDQWPLYGNLTGHPMIVFPRDFATKDGYLLPKLETMIGRLYDESTLLTVADACQRAAKLTQRPPLDDLLAKKEEFLADEKFPDENKYYPD
jgi:hypothetical protein